MARMGLRTTGLTNASTRGTSRAVRMGVVRSWFGGAFSWRGKPSLAFISGTLNSPGYVNILDEKLLPFTEEKYTNGWRFQQDNTKVHTEIYTNEYFMVEGVTVLDWPARIPDLNPIENLWTDLCRRVYQRFQAV